MGFRAVQLGGGVTVALTLLGALARVTRMSQRKVAVFGLSADPPTGSSGHKAIVRELARKFDEVWVLPVHSHVFSGKRSNQSLFEHRLNMCRIAFAGISPTVHVLSTERDAALHAHRSEKSATSTYDVVRLLKRKHPLARLHWVLGADAYSDLRNGKWSNADALQKEVDLLVVPRDDIPLPELGPRAHLLHTPSSNVSSTDVRFQLALRQEPSEHAVDECVASYALQKQLYCNASTNDHARS